MSVTRITNQTQSLSVPSVVDSTVGVAEHAAARRQNNIRRTQNTVLIWVDNSIDESCEDYRNTIAQLQRVVNNIETCTDGDSCIKSLQDLDNNKACLIISGSLGQYLVAEVHDMHQVDSIFIFCVDQKRHEQWIKKWSKIKGVSVDIDLICEMVKQIASQIERNAMPMSFVASGRRMDQLNPTYMYTQIIKEIILTIQFDSTHRQEYINYCRELFAADKTQTAFVNQLQKEYCKENAIWWYTCQCFLYPMLNRALYLMDGDIITKMGFFIQDLHEHIGQLYVDQFAYTSSPKIFITYRGQGLSKTYFEQMQQSKGGLISFNNFLSTSRDRQTALHFAEDAMNSPDLMAVLFVMEINPIRSTTPFAYIADVSDHKSENEVLFSMHSVFRIKDIEQMPNNDQLYEVHLALTSDNDPELYKLSSYMRQESDFDKGGWHRLGAVLLRMGQPSKAEEIYETLLQQTTDDNERAAILDRLGLAKFNQGKYEQAVELCTTLLDIYQKSPSSEPLRLVNILNRMGSAYLSMGNCANALKAHQDARRILQESANADHSDFVKTLNNIGLAYYNMSDYAKALQSQQKALALSQQLLPSTHPDLASLYNNIGSVYQSMGDFEKALSYYEKDITISEQSLPPNHPDLAKSYNNMGSVYQSMGDFEKALSYYEKDLTISQQSLPPDHPDLAKSYNNIGSVYRHMSDYAKALSFHEKALAICQRSLQPGHPDFALCYDYIGNVHRGMGDFLKALFYHQKALAISEQLFSPNHPSLAASHNNIGNVYCSMGKYGKALAFHEKALAIRQQALPTNHPDVGASYSNIAVVYENMRDYPKARLFYERAVRSAEHSLYPKRSNLQLHRENMARVKKKC